MGTKIFVHYNGIWVRKRGQDTYSGNDLQYVLFPGKCSLEELKKKATGLPDFSQGSDFQVYGLVLVDVTGMKRRTLIAEEEVWQSYVEDAPGIPAVFLIAHEVDNVTIDCSSPVTPASSCISRVRPKGNTPVTPASNTILDSSVNDSSSSIRYNNNGDGIETDYVPKAKRRRGISWDPLSPVQLPRLHDAPSTPKYKPDSPPSPPSREVKWYELRHGQKFKNKNQLKLAIEIVRILDDFETCCKSSNPTFLRVVCKDPTGACGWSMSAKKMPSLDWWEITRITAPHSCTGNNMNPLLKKKAMARAMAVLFRKKFARCDVVYSPRQLCEDMKREHGIIITYKQGLTGCKRGIEAVRGSPDESYQHLVSYSYMLAKHNDGTKTAIETDAKGGFLYYFFALGVCLNGFKNFCRPAFAVDGTHLSGERKGTLLSAIGYDANEQMYPIAFAIVDSENGDSCLWFMQKLFDALGRKYAMKEDLVVCSDRSPSFESAIAEVFPSACHVYCAYHLKGNIIKKFHNVDAAEAFMRAAKAYTEDGYRRAITEVQKHRKVYDYVMEVHLRHWARVKAAKVRYTLMTTNIVESWNNILLGARKLPITHLVDFIRSQLMGWFSDRRELAAKQNDHLSDHANDILEGRWKLARMFEARQSHKDIFEVNEGKCCLDQHIVRLNEKSCTCGVFTYEHLPCPHALAVCQKYDVHMYPLCGKYYVRASWRAMYAPPINSVLSQDTWNVPKDVAAKIVLPPNKEKPKGRRGGGKRLLSSAEKHSTPVKKRKCGNCHQVGHNSRSCV